MSGRSVGRYSLHRLGWNAFEDLCMQILRVVLGETCSRFLPGSDGGRDGWFRGQTSGLLAEQNQLEGAFVIQCKHTSLTHESLTLSDLKNEIEKVRRLAQQQPCHYILLTNRKISAPMEVKVRSTFEAVPGIGRCLLLSETWIEDTLDAHPRLLRLVPRLYGVGDLSQIVSAVVQSQTGALLEDLANSLRTFVPTESYRRAERTLQERGFVVLVGPPASGKSAIAANLCMVTIAQNENARVLRIEHAEQFKATWSPADRLTTFWVDDVFGETTLDDGRVREWSAALEKVEAARRREARIIFCTRDYILAAAEQRLKSTKLEIIRDASVRVHVTELDDAERDMILYNHIKEGNLRREQKASLKKHLATVARFPAFSPELARRLGSSRFHGEKTYDLAALRRFFSQPVMHFRDVIHGLSDAETAALAVCLLTGNAVPDPVPDDVITRTVLATYDVSVQEIRRAFQVLEGSLVKRVRQVTSQHWQMHHPSMIEALQEELASKSYQLVLYLQGARLPAILRDTIANTPAADSRLLFLPESVYSHLIGRLETERTDPSIGLVSYLAYRTSEKLLAMVDTQMPDLLDRALEIVLDPDDLPVTTKLAVRLDGIERLGPEREKILEGSLRSSVVDNGDLGFLQVPAIWDIISGFIGQLLEEQVAQDFPAIDTAVLRLVSKPVGFLPSEAHQGVEELSKWIRSLDTLEGVKEGARLVADRLHEAMERIRLPEADEVLARASWIEEVLDNRRPEIEEEEERRADYDADDWKERWHEERYELENGRFSDVDE